MLEEQGKWASVSLRLFGDALPLDEISSRLDLAPGIIARKGQHMRDNPKYARHKTNLWLWSATSDHKVPLEEQLKLTLAVLEPRLDRLVALVRDSDARADLFIGFGSGNGQGGVTFSTSLLERLAKLGFPLEFDLYPPDVDESDG